MNLHSVAQYLKYKWLAKGRHGTHSPFVYDFVERVLIDKGPIEQKYIVKYAHLPLAYENLLSRIAQRFEYEHMLIAGSEQNEPTAGGIDMLMLDADKNKQWPDMLQRYLPKLKNESAVIVMGIHETAEHTAVWNNLRMEACVRMSIDVYKLGIILLRTEFKERQHFTLKY